MEMKLRLNSENAKNEIIELKQFIENKRPRCFKIELEKQQHKNGELGVEWFDLFKIVMSAAVSAAMVKGFFNLLIAFFVDKRKHELIIDRDREKQEIEIRERVFNELIAKGLITIIILDKEGKEQKITLSKFDETEFNHIISIIFHQKH